MRANARVLMPSLRSAFSMDWRTLVVVRVALGAVTLFDARSRVVEACDHFADDGVFPRSAALAQQHNSWALNVFLASGACWYARGIMIAYVLAGIAIVAGYRPCLASALAWLITFSMQGRNPWVHDGGDLYLRSLLFWAVFLPLGDHGSLDNCLRRDYAMNANMAAGLARRLHAAHGTQPPAGPVEAALSSAGAETRRPSSYCTPGTVALLLQVAILYLETYLEKTGPEWVREDSALYYALSLDQFALPAARVLLRYPSALVFLSRASLLLEGFAGPLLLALDGGWRCLVIASVALFHWGTGVTLFLGPFPFICIAAVLAFLPPSPWAWAEATVQTPEAAASRIVLSPALPPSSATARALTFVARACLLGHGGARRARVLHGAELSPAQRTAWGIDRLEDGWQWALVAPAPAGTGRGPVAVSGAPATRRLAALLPLAGPALCWGIRAAAGVAGAARSAVAQAAKRLGWALPGGAEQGTEQGSATVKRPVPPHTAASIGSDAAHIMAACADVLQHAAPHVSAPLRRAVSHVAARGTGEEEGGATTVAWALLTLSRRRRDSPPVARCAWKAARAAGQGVAAVCMAYVVWWCLVQLQEIPGPHTYGDIGLPPPTHRKLFVELLGLNQRWNMFSPAPARYDGWYVLEATTDRNRTVDLWPVLFTGVADEAEVPAPTWDAPEFPAHHYPSTKWHKYMNNYFLPETSEARGHFGAWLCRRFPFVRFVRVVFVTSYNRSFRLRSMPTPYSVSNHNCKEEAHDEWERHNALNDGRFVFALPQDEPLNPIPFEDALRGAPFPDLPPAT